MGVLNDYSCPECGVHTEAMSSDVPECCGRPMAWMPTQINTPEWGGPRQFVHLRDEPFGSLSEFKSWTKKEGLELSPSADKHHGARNEEHLKLGKKYSYTGAPRS